MSVRQPPYLEVEDIMRKLAYLLGIIASSMLTLGCVDANRSPDTAPDSSPTAKIDVSMSFCKQDPSDQQPTSGDAETPAVGGGIDGIEGDECVTGGVPVARVAIIASDGNLVWEGETDSDGQVEATFSTELEWKAVASSYWFQDGDLESEWYEPRDDEMVSSISLVASTYLE